MARLLLAALRHAGHTVEVASTLVSHHDRPDPRALVVFERRAASEASRLIGYWRSNPQHAPDLWFTYHSYYKAPDCVGPSVARSLAIPYATAEASYAAKRDRDQWWEWQRHVADGLRLGSVHFCLTPIDAEGIAKVLAGNDRLVDLPPFIDATPFRDLGARAMGSSRTVELITAAMMRPDVKLESYRFLAATLLRLSDLDWHLSIIGDGPARREVMRAFEGIEPARLAWLGELTPEEVPRRLAHADLYLWPGFGEAYGMAYLEAQAAGLPVVALDSGGVSFTLKGEETGILVQEGDLETYCEAVRSLIGNPERRRRMGLAAVNFVHRERSLERAAGILDDGLAAARRRYLEGGGARIKPDPWDVLDGELAAWRDGGMTACLWLRDDDAVEPTGALDRLLGLTGHFDIPTLLAIIPANATEGLARRLRHSAGILPAQHGFSHANHATFDKAMELGPQRPPETVLAELRAGRERMLQLFGDALCPVLVPPWNRIAPSLLPRLPSLGFDSLSGFGWEELGPVAGLREINCHVDIIDWRGTRGGYEHARLLGDLAWSLRVARALGGRPVGILTHHLVHDDRAWSFLEALFGHTADNATVRWVSFNELRRG